MRRSFAWIPIGLLALAPVRGAADTSIAPAAVAPDRSTPRRALQDYVDAGRAGDWARAAQALDPAGLRGADGPSTARQLKLVLDQLLWLEWEHISDDPAGDPADGPGRDLIGTIDTGSVPVPFAVDRRAGAAGPVWRISAETVRQVPRLWEIHGPGWLEARAPELLRRGRFLELEPWQWLGLLLAVLAAWLVGVVLARVALALTDRLARRTAVSWDERLVGSVRGPIRLLLGVVALGLLVQPLHLAAPPRMTVDAVRHTLLLVALGWIGVRLVAFFAHVVESRMTAGAADDASRRGIRTQVVLLRRLASVVVGLVASALVLTQFEVVRDVGMSLLASAGIAGVVLGLAAQKTISTLLAGIQLSITQPIRIGDTVIVEGEWGQIEEIRLTFVVVKVWDLRRLVVPIGRFLDQPFQNWTTGSEDILGTVELPADYAVPIDAVRGELAAICKDHPLWDGKVCGLQVTAVSERTVTLRALVSSADASKNWDLRCDVRERLVKFLQGLEGGRYLPRARVEAPAGELAASVARAAPTLGGGAG